MKWCVPTAPRRKLRERTSELRISMPGTLGTRTARHTSRSRFASIGKGPIVSVTVFPLASARAPTSNTSAPAVSSWTARSVRSVDMDVPPVGGRYTGRRRGDKDLRLKRSAMRARGAWRVSIGCGPGPRESLGRAVAHGEQQIVTIARDGPEISPSATLREVEPGGALGAPDARSAGRARAETPGAQIPFETSEVTGMHEEELQPSLPAELREGLRIR